MEFIIIFIIGVVAATGNLNPNKQDPEEIAKVPETQVTTPVVKEPEPEPQPEPVVEEPEPEPEPVVEEPEPQPQPEPEDDADPFEGIETDDINNYADLYDVPPPETDNEAKKLANQIKKWIQDGRPKP